MIIYDKTGEVLFDVQVNDSSVRNRAIMGDNSVTLNLSLPEYATIPVGSYIEYQGQRYTLWRPDNFKKHGTRNFEYTITFGSNQEILKRYKYKSLSDIPFQLKFTLTAKPKMFLQLLVDNLNLRDSGWTVGDCIVATEKYLSFNHEYCYDVLGRLAQEFNTEWEIDGKTIHLRKVEKFKTEPLALSYGKGNGFRPGVGRATQGDKSPLNLLFVQGGDRNIDLATYNSRYLLLPKSKELEYEGRKYKTDKDGMYITRADKEVSQYNEDSYDASNIYPSRVGEVTAVTTEEGKDDAGNPVTFYNIVDSTIPADLNYRDCRIAGEKATMIFQTGVLTGREFDIVQTDTDLTGYDHATRTFELVPLEEDGVTLPNENLKPAIGDKYAIFNIKLPQAYIQDDATQTGASWEMFKEAVRYFYENEEEKFSFTGELDPIWAKNKWLEIGGKIVPGGYIQFSDTQFQPDGILIRITSVKDYINKPHAPVIELSNVPVGGSITTDLGKIDSNEVVDENRYKGSISLTKRRFRDLEETGKMLEAAIDGFSEAINPIYIQTMSLQVGSESLQFRFVNNKTNPVETIPNFDYNQKTKVFTAPAAILQHMTLGIDKISPTHKPSDYKFWDMSSYTSPSLDETAAMYFYAKCSKTGTTGSFLLSKTAYKMDPGDGYYYFLVGTLSSEYEGERSYRNVYGFTEVLPGSITTSVIASSDGQTYFNLVDGVIGGKIMFDSGTSGYNNIKDKPDLSIYGTTDMLNAVKDNLQNQIDGKIETYYQSSNPWNSWASGEEPTHVGDLWYNTNSKILQRYVGPSSNTWERIYDADAIAAAEAASTAQDTADGKRRVFLRTPYPPYDAGDQWIEYNGSGSMRICVQSRKSGSYISSDWQLSSADGNTQASIDRGLISAAGFMTFGGSAGMTGSGDIRIWSGGTNANDATFQVSANGDVMARKSIKLQNQQAGITGEGTTDTSVRFWAGGATPANAPFRVYQNGNAFIGGLRMENGGLFSDNSYEFNDKLSSTAKFFLYSQGTSAFVGFSDTRKWAGIGLNVLPSTMGLSSLGRFENTENNPKDTNYGVVISVKNALYNQALVLTGNLSMRGGFSNMERAKYLKFSEGAGSDSIQIWFNYYDTFIINNDSGNYMSVYLPRYDGDITGDYSKTSFILNILAIGTSRINLRTLGTQTTIRDQDGNIINDTNSTIYGNIDMARGDSIMLLYYAQVYYVLNINH